MKIIIILSVFLFVSCSSQNSSSLFSSKHTCIEPENPYSEGGHYEWFKWAELKWTSNCNGKSSSFNEWCGEYARQLSIYNQCKK